MRAVIVEDSRTQAHRLAALLEREGFEVEVAPNGEKGLEACGRRPAPDIVISDILMPEMDGFELCRRIRAAPGLERVPVLLLTSLTDPSDVLRAIEVGADNYLTKPYSDERLLDRVRHMTGSTPPGTEESSLFFKGQRVTLHAPRSQLTALFLSALEDAVAHNKALEKSQAMLQRASEQREELIGIVAHELRNPLQGLSLRADLGKRRNDDIEFLRTLPDAIQRAVPGMVRLIDDLLDVSHIEAGTLTLNRETHDLSALASSVVERMREESGRRIDAQIQGGIVARVDESRIEQVMVNYLSNAFKYSEPDSPIVLKLERIDGIARFSIQDAGIGIPASLLPRVFDRFFRTDDGRRKARGVGLGLHICRTIVQLHGGQVGVDSEEGSGSTFWFDVPL